MLCLYKYKKTRTMETSVEPTEQELRLLYKRLQSNLEYCKEPPPESLGSILERSGIHGFLENVKIQRTTYEGKQPLPKERHYIR
jgi:hypothetical protein